MKQSEREFLVGLRDRFKRISQKEIDQEVGQIYSGEKNPCGCFGAWIAYFYDLFEYDEKTDSGLYDFKLGAKLFRKAVSKDTEVKLDRICGNVGLFSAGEWKMHPAKAINILLKREKVLC